MRVVSALQEQTGPGFTSTSPALRRSSRICRADWAAPVVQKGRLCASHGASWVCWVGFEDLRPKAASPRGTPREYASEVWSPYTMKCIKKIEQIQRNSCRFIFHEYRSDTDTSLLINRLNLDSLYARRLIQQATMFSKIHYNLVDICPPSYIQHANHISSRTDHPLKY